MTPEAQRIAIAEACGWRRSPTGWWNHARLNPKFQKELPDYLNDFNAMHEALMTLDDWDEGAVFDNHLFRILIRRHGSDGVSTFEKVRAESSELAKAFLLTRNIWKP